MLIPLPEISFLQQALIYENVLAKFLVGYNPPDSNSHAAWGYRLDRG